jgi:hypothetical protein
MSELTERWALIDSVLREAARALPARAPEARSSRAGELAGTIAEFEEFLSHNELGLAWDALAAVAEGHRDTALVWFHLAEAANLMEMQEHKERAIRQMIETWPSKDSPYRLGYVMAKPLRKPVPA